MKRWIRWIGSIKIAVPLLVAIAAVLAWGTLYEARFGTASVQRFIYASWWFQALLVFLAVNLAVAAFDRYPWKLQHTPFLLAHVGIILILTGGIIGMRFGIEGQMVIPEGQAERTLETPGNVLVLHDPHSGERRLIPARFETQAWVHEPNLRLPVRLGGRSVDLTVDRYYPDAVLNETVAEASAGAAAIHVLLSQPPGQDDVWLFANDPEYSGAAWAQAHLLFLEPKSQGQLEALLGKKPAAAPSRGVLSLKLPPAKRLVEIPVPEDFSKPVRITGTDYWLDFKDYFPDFIMTGEGLGTRTDQPNNPAVSFVLSGPEGSDAYLLFAMHPEFQALHGFKHTIAAEASYAHSGASAGSLPPQSVAFILKDGGLMAVMTDAQGKRTVIDPLQTAAKHLHPALGFEFEVSEFYPHAELRRQMTNRGDEVHAQAVHVIAREGPTATDAWVMLRDSAELKLGQKPLVVTFRPDQRELPMTIKLLDFRKIDYPGTQMAQAFESNVEMSDLERGTVLTRKIYMNHPLRYRGYSLYQSSYVDGPTQTTVLSVRNDPGTPLVYAGFIIVILGVASLFVFRAKSAQAEKPARVRTLKKGKQLA